MEDINEILDFLKAVGYDGKSVTEEKDLSELINDGPKSKKFRDLIVWTTDEIRVLAKIEEKVSSDGEINDFMIELSGFLKEMLCPFQSFVSGPVSQRLLSVDSRLILLDYLLTELMAMKMCHKLKPKEEVVIEVSESRAAAALKSIATTLKIGKPPNNAPINVVFEKINSRLSEVLQKHPNQLGSPLFNPDKPLKEKQWDRLEELRNDLDTEYDLRRQMLITRLDVTIQSFQWSDRTHGKEDQIAARYTANRKFLDSIQYGGHRTDIVALLAARDDVAIIEKTSSANVRKNTQTAIQKHVIGKVPDRGGRAYEHAPPPPEMPFWQQRSAGGGQGGGGQRGGGRGGSQPQRPNVQRQNSGGFQKQGNYQQHGNNYQQQGNNYNQKQGNNYNQQQSKGNYQHQGNYQQGNYQQQQGNFQSGGYANNRGSGRVQGGWSQAGAQNVDGQSGNRNSGGYGSNGSDSNYNSGGYNNGRGQSNYRRGGRR